MIQIVKPGQAYYLATHSNAELDLFFLHQQEELFFWGIHNQAEVDLLLFPAGRRYGMEIKYTDTPRITASQKQALECLRLDSMTVIVPGEAFYPLADRIFVQGLNHFIRTGPPKI